MGVQLYASQPTAKYWLTLLFTGVGLMQTGLHTSVIMVENGLIFENNL